MQNQSASVSKKRKYSNPTTGSGYTREQVKFTVKAVINKQKNRVLFAEIEDLFADVLFSFLMLPLGNILDVLLKHYGEKIVDQAQIVGSFNALYYGFADSFDIRSGVKLPTLNPERVFRFPYPVIDAISSIECKENKSIYRRLQDDEYFFVSRVFTENTSFIIRDDLRIMPNVTGSIEQTVNNLGLPMADLDGAETIDLDFDLDKTMEFLKGLLFFRHPLTDIILNGTPEKSEKSELGKEMNFAKVKSEEGIQIQGKGAPNSKQMVLKATVERSTNKLLFAQAEDDFIDFLSSLLKIPLGLVDVHFGSNTRFGNIDILYKGLIDLIQMKNLHGPNAKQQLMKLETFSPFFQRVGGRKQMYMVTDDLTVAPLHLSSILSVLNAMEISLSDIKEVELHIGMEEASEILKASLTSTTALSDVIVPKLKK